MLDREAATLDGYIRKLTAYVQDDLVASCGRLDAPTRDPVDLSEEFLCLNGNMRIPD